MLLQVEMPQDEFYAGRWIPYILQAVKVRDYGPPKLPIQHNGEVAASEVIIGIGRRQYGN